MIVESSEIKIDKAYTHNLKIKKKTYVDILDEIREHTSEIKIDDVHIIYLRIELHPKLYAGIISLPEVYHHKGYFRFYNTPLVMVDDNKYHTTGYRIIISFAY